MSKISLLTYHFIPNNGAALFAYSLQQALSETLPRHDVDILDYRDRGMRTYEQLKAFKFYRQVPTFNLKRGRVFARFHERELRCDSNFGRTSSVQRLEDHLRREDQAAWVTGMDVWNIRAARWLPGFPNPYWLPWESTTKKIAYAVSSYRSDDRAVEGEKARLRELLGSFDLIGVRDSYTMEMVREAIGGDRPPVVRVPDPTFLYRTRVSGVEDAMAVGGIDLDRRLLGLLIFGKNELSRRVREDYKARGYQLAALSMYNPFSDVNFGHVLAPHAWAEAFRYFSFCLTDRFHGTIFCLKSGIPFIAIEPDALPSIRHSKLYDLLKEFDLLDCYFDPQAADFRVEALLERAGELTQDWQRVYRPRVEEKLEDMEARSLDFLARVRKVVSD